MDGRKYNYNYEKNQSGAGRLFLFCLKIAPAQFARKEGKWKQSFQPASVQL